MEKNIQKLTRVLFTYIDKYFVFLYYKKGQLNNNFSQRLACFLHEWRNGTWIVGTYGVEKRSGSIELRTYFKSLFEPSHIYHSIANLRVLYPFLLRLSRAEFVIPIEQYFQLFVMIYRGRNIYTYKLKRQITLFTI